MPDKTITAQAVEAKIREALKEGWRAGYSKATQEIQESGVIVVETHLCGGLDTIKTVEGVFLKQEDALNAIHKLRMKLKTKKFQSAMEVLGVTRVEHTMIERPLETFETWKEGR